MTSIDPLVLPAEESGWRPWVEERARGALAAARSAVSDLVERADGPEAVLSAWNEISLQLADAFAVTSLMSSVHPDSEVIALAEAIEVEAHKQHTDLMLDRSVYERLAAVDPDALEDPGARRVLADALRSYRRSGVDRDEETRERLRRLSERETELSQAFSRNIRDGRREVRVPASALAGLPADYVAAHPAEDDGTVRITTEYPDLHPFMAHSTDPRARRSLAWEYHNLAWPENDAVLRELLALRAEEAQLLGYPDWPGFDAEIKMIGSGPAIAEFIDRVAAEALPAARREAAELRSRAALDGAEDLDSSNWRYYLETLKRERFGLDSQQVRRYFDFAKVRAGLLEVTGRLFGLTYRPVEADTWHPEVASYDVLLDGERIGRIHLDLHPRERKYNHAAQFDLAPGVAGRQLAEGVLVCNFPRGLMEHDDVVTLFHEFGHLMHHVLAGRHRWVRFSGVATEWDFVEAPSQLLEEWAWDASVLALFATDETGRPIPAELVERMRAAEEFGKALSARTQMFYAAVSYRFHQEVPEDLTARLRELAEQYSMVALLPDTHFHTGFGHLEGYTSGYYTYAWSLVIAKDLFTAFDERDLMAPEVAQRYRDRILVPGGSADAADLVRSFLGRPYDTGAFTAWLNR